MAAMRVPLWLKILWTVWVAAWAPLYWKHYGAQNLLFFCDLGNFFIALALCLESPLIAPVPKSLHHRFAGRSPERQAFHRWNGIHVRQRPSAVSPTCESVSRGDAATAALGDMAAGVRQARMEVSDPYYLGSRADQLFLAARTGREVGD